MLVLVLTAASLIALCPGSCAEEKKDAAADRAKAVRATYQAVPPTILRIKEPIRVEQFSEGRVPKLMLLILKDADNLAHTFTWWLDEGKLSNRIYDRFYWVRDSPAQRPRRVISPGSPWPGRSGALRADGTLRGAHGKERG